MRDVIEEHLSEAAFSWTQWERALDAPDYTLPETAELEERLLAHVDGLVEAGLPAVGALLEPVMWESEDPGEVFAATYALLALAPPVVLEAVKTRAATAPPSVRVALRRALELGGNAELDAALASWLLVGESTVQAMALEVLAFRGRVPERMAWALSGHADAPVAAAAVRGLGPVTEPVAASKLRDLLSDSRPEVRLAAIEVGLRSGLRVAWEACRRDAVEARRPALVLLALAGDEDSVTQLRVIVEDERAREDALWALGFSGRSEAAEACLEWMGQEGRAARLAGEAFSAITGLRLEGTYALLEEEPESLPPLEEEDLDADLTPRAEDALPLPAHDEVARWWQSVRKGFARGSRYLEGRPFSGTVLLEVLESGPMRRRHVHALELSLRTRGSQGVQVRAFAARQRAELAQASAVRERLPAWSFRG